jgi:hypothetical protein
LRQIEGQAFLPIEAVKFAVDEIETGRLFCIADDNELNMMLRAFGGEGLQHPVIGGGDRRDDEKSVRHFNG